MTLYADGKKIALQLQNYLKQEIVDLGITPELHIIYVGSDPVIDTFVRYKEIFGETIGTRVIVHRLESNLETQDVIDSIHDLPSSCRGIVVQLPLPHHIDKDRVCDAIPWDKDVDVLSSVTQRKFLEHTLSFVPPVVGAILHIHNEYQLIPFQNARICLVGDGVLVGKPMRLWFERENISYTHVTEVSSQEERQELLKNSDIIISGAGVPHLIKGNEVKEGVIIFDAGTSELNKKIVGDVSEEAAEKASFVTPTKGGIGPLTIVVLFTNLLHAYHEST